ncbi:hypothetical protein F5Y11DRAFT_345781 [Daldinia sp. FL1419]|nr:hypothetical protein F5Y11DRAFT_345781 [Daldinia sp. FL1419]
MASSVSGSVGIATETKYCVSNGFLDAFARWSREQGKLGSSVGLGMISTVGYLRESPDAGNILLQNGIYPLNEEEFLKIVDFALVSGQRRQSRGSSHSYWPRVTHAQAFSPRRWGLKRL